MRICRRDIEAWPIVRRHIAVMQEPELNASGAVNRLPSTCACWSLRTAI